MSGCYISVHTLGHQVPDMVIGGKIKIQQIDCKYLCKINSSILFLIIGLCN